MKEKLGKNTKITIVVVCIMLTIIGVAYSYLAPLISGVEIESTISFNSGMIKITYNGSNVITGEKIIPGWSETKEFTVVGSNNTSITDEDIMDYQIKLVVEENTFTDGAIRFELTGSSSNELDTLSPLFGKVPTGTGETLLGTARFNQDESIKNNVTHTYSLKIGFPNRNSVNQNEDMNKSFKAYVVIEEGSLQEQEYEVMLLSDYIDKEYNLSYNSLSTLKEDEFGNIRYVGEIPNNYINFNCDEDNECETWRIIGIVDGNIKIIRQDSITDENEENFYWDESGNNDWTTASLQKYLNNDYYYNLSDTARNMILTRIWNIGGIKTIYDENNKMILELKSSYNQERGTAVYNGRPTIWEGNIALIYPSDYGYASLFENCKNNIAYYNKSGCCSTSNWLTPNGDAEWLLSPTTVSKYHVTLLGKVVSNLAFINGQANFQKRVVRPSLYLKSNIQITSGNGSKDNPFQIELI